MAAADKSSTISLSSSEQGPLDASVSQEDQHSSLPPLVIISTRVKQYGSLLKLTNPGVIVLVYDYDTTDVQTLLKMVSDKLKGRKALSIAFVVHGQPGGFKLTKYNVSIVTDKACIVLRE